MKQKTKKILIKSFVNYNFLYSVLVLIMLVTISLSGRNIPEVNLMDWVTQLLILLFLFKYSSDRWTDSLTNSQLSCTTTNKSGGQN